MSIQDRAQEHITQLDKELGKYSYLNEFEKQTGVSKVYVVLGLAAMYFFLIFFNVAAEFLVNTVGFIIPAYYSLHALFTAGVADDTQWLTYWVVYAFLNVFESAVNAVYWFPFYYTFKFVLVLWMALPQTSGAQIVFRSLLQPVFAKYFSAGSTAENLKAQSDKAQ